MLINYLSKKSIFHITSDDCPVEYLMQLLCNAVFEITYLAIALFVNRMDFYFKNNEFSGTIINKYALLSINNLEYILENNFTSCTFSAATGNFYHL